MGEFALERILKSNQSVSRSVMSKNIVVTAQSLSHDFCDPVDHVDCSPPGSSVHRISQARKLEWVAIPFSRGSSRPRE